MWTDNSHNVSRARYRCHDHQLLHTRGLAKLMFLIKVFKHSRTRTLILGSSAPAQNEVPTFRYQNAKRSTYAYLAGGCVGSWTCNPSGRCWNSGFASLPNSDTLRTD